LRVSDRLYYTDAYLTEFDATVVDRLDIGDRHAVLLDRTAFYPTSGGQPFDVGTLGAVRVVDVIDLDDGRVGHVVDRALPIGAVVRGAIDWGRRFDHMQQHTGQHVLSAAFERLHHARTESFHLGTAASTIDFGATLTADAIVRAEDEANRILWEDRAVGVRFVEADEAVRLPLRKEPVREGTLRLVEIQGVDLSACGGTHVSRTGAVGVIAVSGFERFKGGTRVEFLCGGRALRRFREQREAIGACVRGLSVLPTELPAAIERLQGEVKDQKQAARAMQFRLAEHDAAVLAAGGRDVGGRTVVAARVEGYDAQGLKAVALAIAAHPGRACAVLNGDVPPLLVVARSADVGVDAVAVVRALTATFGGRGGGGPELAQAGGLTGNPEAILAAARELL
jgi:alanyl-tRNA synthetase